MSKTMNSYIQLVKHLTMSIYIYLFSITCNFLPCIFSPCHIQQINQMQPRNQMQPKFQSNNSTEHLYVSFNTKEYLIHQSSNYNQYQCIYSQKFNVTFDAPFQVTESFKSNNSPAQSAPPFLFNKISFNKETILA